MKRTKYKGRMDERTHSQLNCHLRRSPNGLGSANLAVQSCWYPIGHSRTIIPKSSWKTKAKREETKLLPVYLCDQWSDRPVLQILHQKQYLLLNSWSKPVLGTVFGWWNCSPLNCASPKNTLI